jgi:S-adenosylmethionine synthetase
MGDAVTGGGLHGKDLSKADVSVNIVCHQLAQISGQSVEAFTAIGDNEVTFRFADGTTEIHVYADIVEAARKYISEKYGSFEKFAEWGLV